MSGDSREREVGALYDEVYRHSIADPAGFWGKAAGELHWYRKWDRVLDDANPPFFKWFVGGRTNLCYNALDRHALGASADRAAIIWESVARDEPTTITYGELYRSVNRFAGALKSIGVGKGDRVAIYLPMIPEAVIAMLACVRIGAIHCVIFSGFGVDSVAYRIAGVGAKVLITADAGLRRNKAFPLKETADRALENAPVETVIVCDRGLTDITMEAGRDRYWSDLVREKGEAYVEPVPLESSEPSYVIYTSAETGGPRGVVRDTGGYMVALQNSMKQVFNVRDDDVFWAASDVGWVVGHSYLLYAPLLLGATSLLFEGTPDYPDHGVWWRMIEKHRVAVMFAAPTAIRMLKRFGIEHARKRDISSLRHLFLAGEILDVPTWQWASDALDNGLAIDHYWQTESGWPMVANSPGIELLPMKPESPTRAVVGYDVAVVDDAGDPVPAGTRGHLVFRSPLPPGNIMTLWGDDEKYRREYWQRFPGKSLFATRDYAIADEDGYLRILGRADNVLNVAAHRLGGGEIEAAIGSHPAVAEVCVVGVSDVIKGEEPIAFVVLDKGFAPSTRLTVELKNLVRERIGAVAAPRGIRFVPALPKTRDGRCMRRVLRAVYELADEEGLSVTEEGASTDEVAAAIRAVREALA